MIKGGSLARWDNFAIIEEMNQIDPSYDFDGSTQHLKHNKRLWGSCYFFGDIKKPSKNYFITEVAKVARHGLAFTKNIKKYMLKTKF